MSKRPFPAAIATDFLHEVQQRMPVSSVRIDCGSEFTQEQEFETPPPTRHPLHVLLTRRPDSHGSVERSNRTLPVGLYGPSTVATSDEVNRALEGSPRDHHNVRPHHALG